MPYFVVLVGRDWYPQQVEERRAVESAGPFPARILAQADAQLTAMQLRRALRQLSIPADVLEREVSCFLVQAQTADEAKELGAHASYLWTLRNFSSDSDDGAEDRAPRPHPWGGLPSLAATAQFPADDPNTVPSLDPDIRAYPHDWGEQRRA